MTASQFLMMPHVSNTWRHRQLRRNTNQHGTMSVDRSIGWLDLWLCHQYAINI